MRKKLCNLYPYKYQQCRTFFLNFPNWVVSSLVNQKNKQIVLVICFCEEVQKRAKILVRNNWRALSKYCTPGEADTKVQVPWVKILNSKKIKSTWMPLTLFILHITNGESPPSHFCEYVLKADNLQYNMLGRTTHRPCVWCSKHYFFLIISYRLRAHKILYFYFYKFIKK